MSVYTSTTVLRQDSNCQTCKHEINAVAFESKAKRAEIEYKRTKKDKKLRKENKN